MVEVLSESTPVARKKHTCMASEFIHNLGLGYIDFSFAELRQIVKARRQGYKIQPGQKYVRQSNKFDGELYTFKAIPAMHEICLAHDLYAH